MQSQLNITIDDSGLDYIYGSGQSVILVRNMVCTPAPTKASPLVWVAFLPFENNRVTWDDATYALFAAQSGENVTVTWATPPPIQTGIVYTFEDSGIATSAGTGNTFIAENHFTHAGSFVFGMQQQALVNNLDQHAPPLNAVPVPMKQQVRFKPESNLIVFLGAGFHNGQTIDAIPDNALTVDIASGAANVSFDEATKRFVQV